jgi:hypothetical protein
MPIARGNVVSATACGRLHPDRAWSRSGTSSRRYVAPAGQIPAVVPSGSDTGSCDRRSTERHCPECLRPLRYRTAPARSRLCGYRVAPSRGQLEASGRLRPPCWRCRPLDRPALGMQRSPPSASGVFLVIASAANLMTLKVPVRLIAITLFHVAIGNGSPFDTVLAASATPAQFTAT